MHKLRRARVHLNAFHQSADRVRKAEPYDLIRHERDESRIKWAWTWDVERTRPFPFYWPILIGEVLYQIHSALDHLAWQLAFVKSAPHDPERVTFPIYTSESDFWKPGDREQFRRGSGGWRLARIPDEAHQMIVDVQPYKCGNRAPKHPLALLFALSNEDKHKSLHIAWTAVTRQRLEQSAIHNVRVESFTIDRRDPFETRLNDFASLRATVTGPNPHLDVEPGFMFEEVFGEGSPDNAVGELVFESLKVIFNYVLDEVFTRRFVPYFDSLN